MEAQGKAAEAVRWADSFVAQSALREYSRSPGSSLSSKPLEVELRLCCAALPLSDSQAIRGSEACRKPCPGPRSRAGTFVDLCKKAAQR